jgi:hypothetical protein
MKFLTFIVLFIGFVGMLVGLGALFVGLLVGFSALMAIPTLYIVNYLFSPTLLTLIFGVAKIGYCQAWVLNIFCGLLIKSTTLSSKK